MPQERRASLALNDKGERVIKLSFPFDYDILTKVRSLAGRKYHAETRNWSVPIAAEAIEKLREWNFEIDQRFLDYLQKVKLRRTHIEKNGIPGLNGTLHEFQNKGVAFVEANRGRALIADEMGLGKTIQALAWLQLHPNFQPVVIIVPASLKLNWKREAEKWLPNPKVEILSGTSPWKTTGDMLIINYDVLHAWIDHLKWRRPQVLITDESHYYKSNSAKRTKAVKMLAKGIPYVIALSGTPILNRPIEIYNAIKIIRPELFPNYMAFTKRYCNARHNGFGWDFSGHSNIMELHHILTSSVMIRRLKSEVLQDLPDKTYSFVPIELDNAAIYNQAERDFIAFVKAYKGKEAAIRASNAKVLTSIEGLKQLAVQGKLKRSIDWIKNFLDSSDQKLVVFAVHKFVIDALMKEFPDISVKIDGSVSNGERQKSVDNFQNNQNIRLFIGNIQAAGVGITLTAASNVVFLELPWTPGALVQAEDRTHRIGQKDAVTIYYLLAENTIEEKIAKLIDSKRRVLDIVLDGQDTPTESLLMTLINSYAEMEV